MNKRLVIVSGASGRVGASYLRYYSSRGARCVGLFRSDPAERCSQVQYHRADLTDRDLTQELLLRVLSFNQVADVVLVHPVGMFRWEENGLPAHDPDGDGVDDDVLRSNVDTFVNLLNPLLFLKGRAPGWDLTCVAFGSLSDREAVPYWRSYTTSKNILRRILKETGSRERGVYCKMINLPTVKTGNESSTRPHADQSFWMTADEVVASTAAVIDEKSEAYQEVDRFKFSPCYWEGYYADHEAIYRTWQSAMNGNVGQSL